MRIAIIMYLAISVLALGCHRQDLKLALTEPARVLEKGVSSGWRAVVPRDHGLETRLSLRGSEGSNHVIILVTSTSPLTAVPHPVALCLTKGLVTGVVTGKYILAYSVIRPLKAPDILMLVDLDAYGTGYRHCRDMFMIIDKGRFDIFLDDDGVANSLEWEGRTVASDWTVCDGMVFVRRTSEVFRKFWSEGARRVVIKSTQQTITSLQLTPNEE